MDVIAPGIRPGSDTAHLSLLGYPPEDYYTGRGPLEAEGCGITMKPGMIGFRCNYATIDASGLISDRRAGRIHDTAALSRAVETGVDLSRFGVKIAFCSGAGHRAALALHGDQLGSHVSSNDPKREGVPPAPFQPIGDDPADRKTASVLSEFVRQSNDILASHPINQERISRGLPPANTVLCRGAGIMGNFEPFQEKYGMKGAVISAATLITGIGKVVGLVHIPVPGTTGSSDSNIEGKITAAISALKEYDFILVNIKGADEAGHDGLAFQKRDFISRIDSAIEPLLDSGRLPPCRLRRPLHSMLYQGPLCGSGPSCHHGETASGSIMLLRSMNVHAQRAAVFIG